jgi:hypothetical protein
VVTNFSRNVFLTLAATSIEVQHNDDFIGDFKVEPNYLCLLSHVMLFLISIYMWIFLFIFSVVYFIQVINYCIHMHVIIHTLHEKPIKALNLSLSLYKIRRGDTMASMTYVHWCSFELPFRLEVTLCIGYYGIFPMLIVFKVKWSSYPTNNWTFWEPEKSLG